VIDSLKGPEPAGGPVSDGRHFRAEVAVAGALLATEVQLPPLAGPAPASLFRTPYGRENVFPDPAALPGQGVALVNQDVRGRWGSTGNFALGASDVEDGKLTVEWLTRQPAASSAAASRTRG